MITRVDKQYINGQFVQSTGSEIMAIINPSNGTQIGEALLGSEEDVLNAIRVANEAFSTFSITSIEERKAYLQQLHDAILERIDDLTEATISEYGATTQRAEWSNRYAAEIFLQFKDLLSHFSFERPIGKPYAVQACFQNNGQACVAGSRLMIPSHLQEKVKQLLTATVESMTVGLPTNPETQIGPVVSEKQYNRIQHYIRSGIASGAEILIGGEGKPDGLENGFFVKPTVFVNATVDMPIVREEIFGPVLSVLTYKTEEEAIAMVNDTEYGLLAYISSGNLDKAERIAKQINAGRVLINTLWHDAEAPFGGFKQSGVGREGGIFGLEAQLEPKVILMENN